MNPGDLALKAAAILVVVAFVAAVRWARGREASAITVRLAYHGLTACLLFASAMLMAAILTHDFRFEYVAGYSSRELPTLYLVSAFWAGQQGTYLLWALMSAVLGYGLLRKASWQRASVMAAYLPTIGFLVVLMLSPEGNPFRLAARVLPDGRGLNPLLQDPWMASHPPMVFLGYAAMTIPAILAFVALVKREHGSWVLPALRWSLLAFVLLGVGIVLGGFWAYKVLGWGGYWGWDPVENASLVPWIVVAALIHGLLVQKGRGALVRTNTVLALCGYLAVLYATFLTRSGVLADFSVHSFPAGSIYRLLVGIMLLALAGSAYAVARGRRAPGASVEAGLAWPVVLTIVVIGLSVSAAIVLIGTSWPILSSLIGQPATPGPPFYNRTGLPLYVVLLGLLALAPFLAWAPEAGRGWRRRVVPALVVGAVGTAVAVAFGGRGPAVLTLWFAALAALTSNLLRFATVARARLLHTGASVAHVGFALMFVGIVASSAWGVKDRVALPLGRPVDILDRIVTFRGHVEGSSPEDRWWVAVQKPGQAELLTQVTFYAMGGGGRNDSVFRRPAIVRSWAGDLYVAPLGLEDTGRGSRLLDLAKGRSERYGEATLDFSGFEVDSRDPSHGMTVRVRVKIRRAGREETVALPFGVVGGRARGEAVVPKLLPEISLTVDRLSVEQSRVLVAVEDRGAAASRVMSVEISTHPLIGLLWAGTILLGLGCTVAITRRVVDRRLEAGVHAASPDRRSPERAVRAVARVRR